MSQACTDFCPPFPARRIRELLEAEIRERGSRPVQHALRLSGGEFTKLRSRGLPLSFRMADKVVTRLWGPATWLSDPDLRAWYL